MRRSRWWFWPLILLWLGGNGLLATILPLRPRVTLPPWLVFRALSFPVREPHP